MNLHEFKEELGSELEHILASDFEVSVLDTDVVPSGDDPDITYPNLATGRLKCKLIETCVIHVDLRRSTNISFDHRRATLAKLYSGFIRAMVRCAGQFGGKVRGIVGDRVMVIFNRDGCFGNAIDTAVLMNSVAKFLLDERFSGDDVACGIGIDYGKMLATKVGIIKRGTENTENKSLVWLGKPANAASKLTDAANKIQTNEIPIVREGLHYPTTGAWTWHDRDPIEFVESLEKTFSSILRHPNEYFSSFYTTSRAAFEGTPPILMTKAVYEGFKRERPDAQEVRNGWYGEHQVPLAGSTETVYGGDVHYTIFGS